MYNGPLGHVCSVKFHFIKTHILYDFYLFEMSKIKSRLMVVKAGVWKRDYKWVQCFSWGAAKCSKFGLW